MAKVIRVQMPTRMRQDELLRIYPIGDCHLGAAACNEERLSAHVARVADDDDGYWIGMGDYGDYINRNDRRHREENLAPWLRGEHDISRLQTKRFLQIVEPIAGKCLGLLKGNHEAFQEQRFERNVFYDIVDGVKFRKGGEGEVLGIDYTGWFILSAPKTRSGKRKDGSNTLTINCHHGSGGATTRGGRLNKLEKYATLTIADLVLVGHMHDCLKIPLHMRCVAGEREVTTPRWAALTGTFLDTRNPDGYTTYGEEKMYAPLPPSHIVIEWYPRRPDPYERIRILEEW